MRNNPLPTLRARAPWPAIAILIGLSLSGCLRGAFHSYSPGEIEAPNIPAEHLTGYDNPAIRTVAVIANRRGDILMSTFIRPDRLDNYANLGEPDGGERMISLRLCNKVLEDVSRRMGYRRSQMLASFVRTVAIGSTAAYGLAWTLPGKERRGGESAWDNAARAIATEAGPRMEMLKTELFFVDELTQSAYIRLRYTGQPDDQFVFSDPIYDLRKPFFHHESAWLALESRPVQLMISYLMVADGLDADAVEKLFDFSLTTKFDTPYLPIF